MGRAKEALMQQQEQGFSFVPHKYVCGEHIDDYAIKDHVNTNGSSGNCDYCDSSEKKNVILLKDYIAFINDGLRAFFTEPVNEMAFDSSEGGYYGAKTWDTIDLFELLDINIEGKKLFDEFFCKPKWENNWCEIDPYHIAREKELKYLWDKFCEHVKHNIRYSFFKSDHYKLSDNDTMESILNTICSVVDDFKCIKIFEEGQEVFRGRQHNSSVKVKELKDISSPPVKYATSANRMSPAGISMFYGAGDEKTVESETVNSLSKDNFLTIGKLISKKKFNVIDFANLPTTPSIFDKKRRKDRYKMLFLNSFIKDLSKEIIRDEKVHIEYVPTQIITEYFRFVFPQIYKNEIKGLLYKSSKNKDGICCVLFFDNKECEEYFLLDSKNKKQLY